MRDEERHNILVLLAEVLLWLGLAVSARQAMRTTYKLLERSSRGGKI